MSTIKAVGRRLFAKAAVGAPMALKGGAVGLAGPQTPTMGMSAASASAADIAKQTFFSKVYDHIRKGTRTEQEHGQLRWARRQMMGGLDPDLAVLNSMSLQRRVQIQIDRENQAQAEERSLRHRIIRGLGGNPEDFE